MTTNNEIISLFLILLKNKRFLNQNILNKILDTIFSHKPKMKYSIVPEIINHKKISFTNEKNVVVFICKKSPFRYINPFEKPFIVFDTFARKTSMPKEIVNIDLIELKKIGFILTSTPSGRNSWFSGQRKIYRIEPSSNISPGSKKISHIPGNHTIRKDVVNNMVKLIGPNAGYPRRGDGGPWIQITTK